MLKNNCYIAMLTLSILVTGSAIAWFYFNDGMPKKAPIRAKQVLLQDIRHNYADHLDSNNNLYIFLYNVHIIDEQI